MFVNEYEDSLFHKIHVSFLYSFHEVFPPRYLFSFEPCPFSHKKNVSFYTLKRKKAEGIMFFKHFDMLPAAFFSIIFHFISYIFTDFFLQNLQTGIYPDDVWILYTGKTDCHTNTYNFSLPLPCHTVPDPTVFCLPPSPSAP